MKIHTNKNYKDILYYPPVILTYLPIFPYNPYSMPQPPACDINNAMSNEMKINRFLVLFFSSVFSWRCT